jgi:hypothetical protein
MPRGGYVEYVISDLVQELIGIPVIVAATVVVVAATIHTETTPFALSPPASAALYFY